MPTAADQCEWSAAAGMVEPERPLRGRLRVGRGVTRLDARNISFRAKMGGPATAGGKRLGVWVSKVRATSTRGFGFGFGLGFLG